MVVAITGNIHGIKHAYRCVSVGNKIDHYKNKLPVLLPNIPVFITHLKCSPINPQVDMRLIFTDIVTNKLHL